MSIKRPVIKYRNKNGRIILKKVPTNYVDVWEAFRTTFNTVVLDVLDGKYDYKDVVDINFEHTSIKRKYVKKEKRNEIT